MKAIPMLPIVDNYVAVLAPQAHPELKNQADKQFVRVLEVNRNQLKVAAADGAVFSLRTSQVDAGRCYLIGNKLEPEWHDHVIEEIGSEAFKKSRKNTSDALDWVEYKMRADGWREFKRGDSATPQAAL